MLICRPWHGYGYFLEPPITQQIEDNIILYKEVDNYFNSFTPKSAKVKSQEKLQISFCKIHVLKYKYYHVKVHVLLKRYHWNGHIIAFIHVRFHPQTQKLELLVP